MPGVRIASTLALTSVGAALLLAGCGSDPGPSAATSAPASPAASAPSAPSAPGGDPSAPAQAPATSAGAPADAPSPPSSASAAPSGHGHKVDRLGLGRSARAGATASAAGHLLDAARLPVLAGARWTQVDRPEEGTAVGACQKTGLEPIGAMEEVRRSFTAPGGLTATQVVARFPDARSAWRAQGVLVAWRDDCEQRVSGAAVGPLQPVGVRVGDGDSYRASYSAHPRTAGLGILRTGAWITVVEVSSPGAYPQDWDPARVALRRAARTF